MSTPLAIRIRHWRCELVAAGAFLEHLYSTIDRKQWDRAERMCRKTREVLSREQRKLSGHLTPEGFDDHISTFGGNWQAERAALLKALQSLLCLVALFGMAWSSNSPAKGLQGQCTETSKALAVALHTAQTAFPEESFSDLLEEALALALVELEAAIQEDMSASGVSEVECMELATAARKGSEYSLREFIRVTIRG